MPNNKNVDEILKEYAHDDTTGSAKPTDPAKNRDSNSISNTAVYSPQQIKAVEEALLKRPAPSHQYGKFAVSDVSRPNISYINSVTEVRKTAADLPPKPTDLIEGYDGAVMIPQPEDESYVPKVRKMSNSTRAKEMREIRRKKKHKKQPVFTYAHESPDGIYTKPEKKSKKFVINRDAGDDPPPVDDDGNIIPLSEQKDPGALDIKITEIDIPTDPPDDANDKKRSKRSKADKSNVKKQAIKDYDSYEDAREIKRDINEVRENIRFRITVLFIMLLFSSYLAFADTLHLPIPQTLNMTVSPLPYCIVQLIVLVLSAAIAITTFKNGLVSLIKFRPDSDSIASLAMTASIAASAAAIASPGLIQKGSAFIYAPVGILGLLVNSIGKKKILNRMSQNFDYISKNHNMKAIVCVEDSDRAESLTRGTIGDYPILTTMKKASFLKDFASFTYSADTGDRFSSVISPLVFLFSILAAAGVTFIRRSTFDTESVVFGLSVFSAIVSACSCISIPLVANIPLEKASKKYSRNHGVMLGYQSVEDFYDTNSVMVSADSFFPAGSVNLVSIKLFSGTKIDSALLEAASLASHANSILKELLEDIVSEKSQPLSKVENFVYEDSMGLCGWINNRRVLLGNRELMSNHKIEGLPTTTKEKEFTEGGKEALYLSVSGNLAAMFIIEISASPRVIKFMKKLERKNIAVIVKTVDSFITINKLSTLFRYSEDLIKIIPPRMVKDFDEETKSVRKISTSMACSGRFMSFMQLIMGTKSIKNTVTIGIVIQAAAALLGFGIVTVTNILNAAASVSPFRITLCQIACTLFTALIVRLRKV